MAVGVALFGLFASMGMSSMSFSAFALAFLLFLMCAGTGFNAAGVVLMDEASGASSRSFTDALLAGLFALGKAIVVMILAGLAFRRCLARGRSVAVDLQDPGRRAGAVLYRVSVKRGDHWRAVRRVRIRARTNRQCRRSGQANRSVRRSRASQW